MAIGLGSIGSAYLHSIGFHGLQNWMNTNTTFTTQIAERIAVRTLASHVGSVRNVTVVESRMVNYPVEVPSGSTVYATRYEVEVLLWVEAVDVYVGAIAIVDAEFNMVMQTTFLDTWPPPEFLALQVERGLVTILDPICLEDILEEDNEADCIDEDAVNEVNDIDEENDIN